MCDIYENVDITKVDNTHAILYLDFTKKWEKEIKANEEKPLHTINNLMESKYLILKID